MSIKPKEWAESYFSRLKNTIEALQNHDLVKSVEFLQSPGATEQQIAEAEAKIYAEQIEVTENHDTEAPQEPFIFNEYLREFYKISNGLHISWHSVIFQEEEKEESYKSNFPIAKDEDDFKEGWISILPIEGLANPINFDLSGDPRYTTWAEDLDKSGVLFNYFDGFNFYYDACITLSNGNPSIAFGDDYSASYDAPHACDFVIYMEYALSTFFSVECRSKGLYFSSQHEVYPELENMVETQDYSKLESLLKDNQHTDIDSVIALGYEEKGCEYADEDYMEKLPEAIRKRLNTLIEV
ncbi:hypothetical protein DRF65_10600 [Chryseobacterium pennae]|uniref:Uncharacterized protein n=1 Tax=Chryseobacterium pennae TaxID=2258962 RepID=A0A3D9C9H1_9FLAO|nr:hypothetical protein [Chryseobacterium pennae]REC62530.1 hypothetical protein DRF65_10600 [Chryseobacterium pennae]